MVVFWLSAIAMVLVASAIILVPLWRQRHADEVSRDSINTAIFRERLANLDAGYQAGQFTETQYRQLRAELERTLLVDVPEEAMPRRYRSGKLGLTLGSLTAVLVPLLALGYYYLAAYRGEAKEWIALQERFADAAAFAVHDPAVLTEKVRDELPDFTRVLQAHLLREGMDDAEGLYLLGDIYLQLRQVPLALSALQRAYELAPEQPHIMLAYAQTLIFSEGGQLTQESMLLLNRVLQSNPHDQRALFLLGLGAFNSGNYAQAIASWQSLLALRDPNGEGVRLIKDGIAQAKARLAERNKEAMPDQQAAPAGPQIAVTVDISPKLRGKFSSENMLFIFAKAASGPPMPLAAVRQPVRDFPVQVVLNDSQSMAPTMKLSSFKQVVVGARISKAGNVTAQPGDLQGASSTFELKDGVQSVALVIDHVVQ